MPSSLSAPPATPAWRPRAPVLAEAGDAPARLHARLAALDVLVLPGWNDSGPGHWQTRWESRFPAWRRVRQADWAQPRRADWVATLDQALANARRPVLLVAHSLGCVTAAHWARAHGGGRIAAALLVAPADVERSSVAESLRDFAPLPRQPLPFPALVVASDDDPACSAPRATALARDWGADLVLLSRHGHINAESGLGDWDSGLVLLEHWLGRLPRD